MRERDLAVLEQYELQADAVSRGRGSYICSAGGKDFLLQEYHGSEKKARLQQQILFQLEESGFHNVDTPVASKEGNIVTKTKDGNSFILKKRVEGRECDVCRKDELKCASANLARLHKLMYLPGECIQTEQNAVRADCCRQSFSQVAARHNRELKKVRSYVRSKKKKTDFEFFFLQYFTMFYEKGAAVQEAVSGEEFERLHQQALFDGKCRHGDYSQHNVLFTSKGIAAINFEHFVSDVQLGDLVHFIRKILEKYDWDESLGMELVEAYDREYPLSALERRYFALRLSYPEKFWKLSSRYYNMNKAWPNSRNTSKLVRLAVQETRKNAFIRQLSVFF